MPHSPFHPSSITSYLTPDTCVQVRLEHADSLLIGLPQDDPSVTPPEKQRFARVRTGHRISQPLGPQDVYLPIEPTDSKKQAKER